MATVLTLPGPIPLLLLHGFPAASATAGARRDRTQLLCHSEGHRQQILDKRDPVTRARCATSAKSLLTMLDVVRSGGHLPPPTEYY
jgi:hypothetical protein